MADLQALRKSLVQDKSGPEGNENQALESDIIQQQRQQMQEVDAANTVADQSESQMRMQSLRESLLGSDARDPITGNQRAFHANGVSPEKAINESPLTAGQRLKLSFSDEKGKMKFLQETFGAVHKTKGGQLAVPSGGKWHYVDPEGFGAVNPWKLTGDLLSGDVGVKEYLEGMAVSSAEEIGDIADIAKEIGLGAASAGAAALTGGASLLAQAGAMGAAGAGVSLASTSMGKGMGTYSGNIEDQLQEAGIEGLFNLAGGYVVPKGLMGIVKGSKHLKGAVISSGDDLAKAIDKNRVGHFMLKQADNLAKKTAGWTSDAKEVAGKILLAGTKISDDSAEVLMNDTQAVKKALAQAVSGRKDGAALDYLSGQSRENSIKFAREIRTGLNQMYDDHMGKIKEALPDNFNMQANGAAKTLTDALDGLGVTKGGDVLSFKKLQALADVPELADNPLIRELSSNPKARSIVDRLVKRINADVKNTRSLKFDDAIKVDKRVRKAFTQAMKEADDPSLNILREFKNELGSLKDTYVKNFDSIFETAAMNTRAAQVPETRTMANILRNSQGKAVTTAKDPVQLYRELKSAYNEASREASIFTTLNDKFIRGSLDARTNDPFMSVAKKVAGHAQDTMVSDKALQVAQNLGKYNPAITEARKQILINDAAGIFVPKVRTQFMQYATTLAVGGAIATGEVNPSAAGALATTALLTSPRAGFKALLASKGAKQAFLGSLRRVRSLAGSIPQNKLQELMSNPEASNLLKQSLIRPVASQVNTELQLQQMMQQQAQGGAQ